MNSPSPVPWEAVDRLTTDGGVWIRTPDGFIAKVFGNSETSHSNARVMVAARQSWEAVRVLWELLSLSKVDWDSPEGQRAASEYEATRKKIDGTDW